MSWWDSAGITSFATSALKSAQKKIDKVLDINDDGVQRPEASAASSSSGKTSGDGDTFWNAWLGAEGFGSPQPSSASKSTTKERTECPEPIPDTVSEEFSDKEESEFVGDHSSKASGISPGTDYAFSLPGTGESGVTLDDTATVDSVRPKSLVGQGQKNYAKDDTAAIELESQVNTKIDSNISSAVIDSDCIDEKTEDVESDPSRVSDNEKSDMNSDAIESDKTTLSSNADLVSVSLTESENADDLSGRLGTVDDVDGGNEKPINREENTNIACTDSFIIDHKNTDWGDVSLSCILSDNQESVLEIKDVISSECENPVVDKRGDDCDTDRPDTSCVSGVADMSLDSDSSMNTVIKISDTESDQVDNTSLSDNICDKLTDVTESKITDMEQGMSGSMQEKLERSDSAVVISSADVDAMDDSLETSSEPVDELSESNRTLTADEFELPKENSASDSSILKEDSSIVDKQADSESIKETMSNIPREEPCVPCQPTVNVELPDNDEDVECQSSPVSQNKDTGIERKTEPVHSPNTSISNSFVKNMLEEAMVESIKDNDSHTDSHSSSEMVRIESGQNSGHTSADEIETTTSSDIEIISHISTPTPNGDNRIDRPFDLSPLRHALSRSIRRNSPPGHKRTDSGSSGYSLQSRNGDDLATDVTHREADPGHARQKGQRSHSRRMRLPEEEETEAPEDSSGAHINTDQLLKDANITELHTIVENVESQRGKQTATLSEVSDNILCSQKLSEMAEVLDAREHKLLDLSKENCDLVETNSILRNQLQQLEETRENEMSDVKSLTDEFTQRLGESEKKLQTALRERESYKKQLKETKVELTKKSNNSADVEILLKEREQQVTELLAEGEKLSKQQLQSNNIIKKLRVNQKENESLIKSNKVKLESQKGEIERLQKILDAKIELEKRQVDAINQLNNAMKKQEAEVNRLKSDFEDAEERVRSMQGALDNSYKEIAGLHKSNVSKASEVQEAALSAEMQAKEELRFALEQYQQQTKREQETLVTQIEDLRITITRMEKEQGRREDVFKQDISDLQQRLQEAEERNQVLSQSVTAATRPLLRQLENLQSTYAAQSASFEKVEKNLSDRLAEAQSQLAAATQKERQTSEALLEITTQVSSLESQVSSLRHEKSRAQAQLQMEKSKVDMLEETKHKDTAQFDAMKQSMEHEVSQLTKEKVLVENQLEIEKMKLEAEKKKLVLAHEQLRDKELQLCQTPVSPAPSRSSSFTAESPMTLSQQEEILERTMLLAASNGSKMSLYDSLRQSSASSLIENLQSQLKQRDGEIVQLQSDIAELERTRESMARELVDLTNKNEELQKQLHDYPEFQKNFTELDQRYNALLQMYGEKVEETEELHLDLQEVKEMYKSQIDQLTKKISF